MERILWDLSLSEEDEAIIFSSNNLGTQHDAREASATGPATEETPTQKLEAESDESFIAEITKGVSGIRLEDGDLFDGSIDGVDDVGRDDQDIGIVNDVVNILNDIIDGVINVNDNVGVDNSVNVVNDIVNDIVNDVVNVDNNVNIDGSSVVNVESGVGRGDKVFKFVGEGGEVDKEVGSAEAFQLGATDVVDDDGWISFGDSEAQGEPEECQGAVGGGGGEIPGCFASDVERKEEEKIGWRRNRNERHLPKYSYEWGQRVTYTENVETISWSLVDFLSSFISVQYKGFSKRLVKELKKAAVDERPIGQPINVWTTVDEKLKLLKNFIHVQVQRREAEFVPRPSSHDDISEREAINWIYGIADLRDRTIKQLIWASDPGPWILSATTKGRYKLSAPDCTSVSWFRREVRIEHRTEATTEEEVERVQRTGLVEVQRLKEEKLQANRKKRERKQRGKRERERLAAEEEERRERIREEEANAPTEVRLRKLLAEAEAEVEKEDFTPNIPRFITNPNALNSPWERHRLAYHRAQRTYEEVPYTLKRRRYSTETCLETGPEKLSVLSKNILRQSNCDVASKQGGFNVIPREVAETPKTRLICFEFETQY